MAKLVIGRSLLDAARERCSLTNDEQEEIIEEMCETLSFACLRRAAARLFPDVPTTPKPHGALRD